MVAYNHILCYNVLIKTLWRYIMFKNIGNKIKTLAVIIFIVGLVISLIMGVLLIGEDMVADGLLIIIFGALVSWISVFFIYAYGELVQRSINIDEKLKNLKENDDGQK